MKLEFSITLSNDFLPNGYEITLRLTSNINMAEFLIKKWCPFEYTKDIRKRVIKDIFYELQAQVEDAEDDFARLIGSYKGAPDADG